MNLSADASTWMTRLRRCLSSVRRCVTEDEPRAAEIDGDISRYRGPLNGFSGVL
jgi:hypothetical protein